MARKTVKAAVIDSIRKSVMALRLNERIDPQINADWNGRLEVDRSVLRKQYTDKDNSYIAVYVGTAHMRVVTVKNEKFKDENIDLVFNLTDLDLPTLQRIKYQLDSNIASMVSSIIQARESYAQQVLRNTITANLLDGIEFNHTTGSVVSRLF